MPDDLDPYGYISVDTLLLLTRLDGEITRASDYHKLIWKDMIHAVLHEVPKLRIHVKVLLCMSSVSAKDCDDSNRGGRGVNFVQRNIFGIVGSLL